MTVNELYEQTIKNLSADERLQLAKQILNDIPENALTDVSTEWSDEDLEDISAFNERANEPTMSFEELLVDLKAHGKI